MMEYLIKLQKQAVIILANPFPTFLICLLHKEYSQTDLNTLS